MIAKKILQTSSVQFAALFLGIVAGVFITRLLGPEGRGVYAIFKADVELAILFLAFGIGSITTYFVSNEQISIKKLFSLSLIVVVVGILIAMLILGLSIYLPALSVLFPKNYDSIGYRIYIIASFSFGLIGLLFSGFLAGIKRFGEINAGKLISSVATLAAMIGLYSYLYSSPLSDKIDGVLAVVLLVTIGNTLFLGWWFITKLKSSLGFTLKIGTAVKTAYGFVIFGYISDLVNFLNYRLDIWLVEYFSNTYQLGLYTLAVSVGQLLWLIPVSVSMVLLPYLNSSKNSAEAEAMFFFTQRSLSQSPSFRLSPCFC